MAPALEIAAGVGVGAMLIAWQTINAVRRPNSTKFTRGFLVVTPGITIRDRLRVLQPNDPDSYYQSRELVPNDMLADLDRAKIIITNFHAFKLRERMDVSKGTRGALEGWRGERLETIETEGQMLQRVMPDLMGMKRIVALNDEAHHCYREKPGEDDEGDLTGDDKKEAEKNREAARLWISGLEAVNRKIGVSRVFDLSATPFFLRGSGYAEGTLFPWTMSDFSLKHLGDMRRSSLTMHVTKRLLYTKWRDPGDNPKRFLFPQLSRITRQWLDNCLVCKGSTYSAQLMYPELADMACERITAAITRHHSEDTPIKAVLDPYNPTGSTMYVNFNTSKKSRWETDSRRCHINWVVLDSDWEAEFCRVAEAHPRVRAYVKNHNLGLEVPYRYGSETRRYIPDFIVQVDDGHDDPLRNTSKARIVSFLKPWASLTV